MALRFSFTMIILVTVTAQKHPLNEHEIIQKNDYRDYFTYNTFPYVFTKRLTTKYRYFDLEEQLQNTVNIGSLNNMSPRAFSRAPPYIKRYSMSPRAFSRAPPYIKRYSMSPRAFSRASPYIMRYSMSPRAFSRAPPYIMRYYTPRNHDSHKSKQFKVPSINKLPEKPPRDYATAKRQPPKTKKKVRTPDPRLNDKVDNFPLKYSNFVRNKNPRRAKDFFNRNAIGTKEVRFRLSRENSETLDSSPHFNNKARDILPSAKPSNYAKHLYPLAEMEYPERYDTRGELALQNSVKYSPQTESNNYIRHRSPPAELNNYDKDYPQAESENSIDFYKETEHSGRDYDSPATIRNIHAQFKIDNSNRYNPQADNFHTDLYPQAELQNYVGNGPQTEMGNYGRSKVPLDDGDLDSDKELFITPEERQNNTSPAMGISNSDEIFPNPEENPVTNNDSAIPGDSPGGLDTETPIDSSVVNTPADPLANTDLPQKTTPYATPPNETTPDETTPYETTPYETNPYETTTTLNTIPEHVTTWDSIEEYKKKRHKKHKNTHLTTHVIHLPDITESVDKEKETHPYVVAMMLEERKKNFITVCSGSLITELWVLVAAHCLHEDPKVLENGRIYYGNFSVASKSYRKIKKVVPFPNYYYGIEYAGPIKNDIGLVMVDKAIRRNICRAIGKLSSIDYQVLIGSELRYAVINTLRNWAPPLLPSGVITITGQLPEYPQATATNTLKTDNLVSVKCPVDFLGPSICLHRKCRNNPIKVKPQDVGSPILFHDRIVGICSGYSTYQTENRDEYVLRYTPVSPYLDWIYDVVTKKEKKERHHPRQMPYFRRFVHKGIPKPRPFAKAWY